eukprot:NODE_3251_length_1015_cov_9.246377_g2989_i0.p1 GENE.NODE_3251_length_1015_cov_9.246377_g2989_i0~~NODE_3251_length_1015_cov_9.246377_g2989_i0.p1  ORF type:complete len:299 (+),score=52.88 NODE_3251_length_1015_cov_9.246377_g2989_i0:56-898(+)
MAQTLAASDSVPAIIRCYDEYETTLSFSLRSQQPLLQDLLSQTIKGYLRLVRGFKMEDVSLVILGFEANCAASIKSQRAYATKVCSRLGGFCVGKGAGDNWQKKKYDLPLVRDFVLDHGLWADVFETVLLYSNLLACWKDVRESLNQVWASQGTRGWVGCHISHQYATGACLYFTYCGTQRDKQDMEIFLKLKQAAMGAILRHGGGLTHHHGIGYEHVPWMNEYLGRRSVDILRAVKKQVDPKGLCNPGKLLPPESKDDKEAESQRNELMFFKMGIPSKL